MLTDETRKSSKMIVGAIADINYYNNEQNIIRIKLPLDIDLGTYKFYDFYLIQSIDYPNPIDHHVMIIAPEDILDGTKYAMLDGDSRLDFPPGYQNEKELEKQISWGFAWLINRRLKQNTSNMNDTSAGMHNTTASIPADPNKLKYSISPALPKDYTTTKAEYTGDLRNENIGIFVTDNSVVIKSEQASIVVGPQGISLLGDKFESSTKGGKSMMMDNPFAGWMPSTMMTIPLGIPYIPNLNFILGIGTACRTLNTGMSALGKITKSVNTLIGRN